MCAAWSVCVCEIHLAVMLTARQQEPQDKCENNSKRRVKSEKFHLMQRRLISTFSTMRSNDTCAKDYGGIPAILLLVYVVASMLGTETKSRKMWIHRLVCLSEIFSHEFKCFSFRSSSTRWLRWHVRRCGRSDGWNYWEHWIIRRSTLRWLFLASFHTDWNTSANTESFGRRLSWAQKRKSSCMSE